MDCRNKCGNDDNYMIFKIKSSFADLIRESVRTGIANRTPTARTGGQHTNATIRTGAAYW